MSLVKKSKMERLEAKLELKEEDLALARAKLRKMLSDDPMSYSIGGRSLTRYNMQISELRTVIKSLEEEIEELENEVYDSGKRKAVSVVIRDI